MAKPAFRLRVRVREGELRVNSPFRELVIRGWPELTARTRARYPWRVVVVPSRKRVEPEAVAGEALLHRLGPCAVDEVKLVRSRRWERAKPELDLARALIMPLGCCVHEQARRWRALASGPEPFREAPAKHTKPLSEAQRAVVNEAVLRGKAVFVNNKRFMESKHVRGASGHHS